ncbi:hypothetical protein CYMTET_54402 [Cymbomonas tetramitiformis]|uniref:Uncharacterized protein n=1 Tax=Cymbomonas tetramitiformis TaxID=36881 RepID=A0AAE0BG66_9CHLO|nr:hypothetical protein CYMTET_54402 [Cymbomonas tetramitiformis]
MFSSKNAVESGGSVTLVLSHHPSSAEDAKVSAAECIAARSKLVRLTESKLEKGATERPLFVDGEARVLELDWASGAGKVQVPVTITQDGAVAKVDASVAGQAMVMLRRAEDGVALTAPVLLRVGCGTCAGMEVVSATPPLDKVPIGQMAMVTVRAVDEYGNQVSKSAGALTATAVMGANQHKVKVHDAGDGTYQLALKVPELAAFSLDCQLSVSKASPLQLSLAGCSIAGSTVPACCTCEGLPSRVLAGERVVARVHRCDVDGNKRTYAEAEMPLQLKVVTGPGPAESSSKELGDGAVEMSLMARLTGRYTLDLVASGAALPGGKGTKGRFSLLVEAGKVDMEKSTAVLYAQGKEVATMRAPAGDVTVAIQARDEEGNDAALENGARFFAVYADGPQGELAFTPTKEVVKGLPEGTMAFSTSVKKAGIYSVHVKCLQSADPDSREPGSPSSPSRGAAAAKPAGRRSRMAAGRLSSMSNDSSQTSAALAGWPQILTVLSTKVDPKLSVLDGSALAGVTCWQPCHLMIHGIDQYGNPKMTGGDKVEVVISREKEKDIKAKVVDNDDGTYGIEFTLGVEGSYTLQATINGAAVENHAGQLVRGGLAQLRATHGDIDPEQCVLTGLGSPVVGTEGKIYVKPVQFDAGHKMSGQEAVQVQVTQPSGIRRSVPPTMAANGGMFTASIPWNEAGVHVITVLLGGVPITGCPKEVPVAPGDVDPRHCTLHGAALAGVTCWDENVITLEVKDKFGNLRQEGDDRVEATLVYQEDKYKVQVGVAHMDDGRFSLKFKLMKEGAVGLFVKVNGSLVQECGSHFAASAGTISASKCAVVLPPQPTECGKPVQVYVQAAQWADGRVVGKDLPVSIQLIAPSGTSMPVETEFLAAEGRFVATVTCSEMGDHRFLAHVAGEAVDTEAVVLRAMPGPLALKSCDVEGVGARKAIAGEVAAFTMRARDAFGNLLNKGGAKLELEAKAGAQQTFGSVVDKGDGTYMCEYQLTTCGAMEVLLSQKGSRAQIALEGVCAPGRTAPGSCAVLECADQVEADTLGSIVLVRKDTHGNVIDSSAGQPPLTVSNEGPSQMEMQVHEKGDGTVRINYRAQVSGSYVLSVLDSEKRAQVAGSPFHIQVLPGPASAAESVWSFSSGREIDGGESRVAQAGEAVVVTVLVRDAFGNACELEGNCEVRAVGPVEQILEMVTGKPKDAKAGKGALMYSGRLTASGSYKLKVNFFPEGSSIGAGAGEAVAKEAAPRRPSSGAKTPAKELKPSETPGKERRTSALGSSKTPVKEAKGAETPGKERRTSSLASAAKTPLKTPLKTPTKTPLKTPSKVPGGSAGDTPAKEKRASSVVSRIPGAEKRPASAKPAGRTPATESARPASAGASRIPIPPLKMPVKEPSKPASNGAEVKSQEEELAAPAGEAGEAETPVKEPEATEGSASAGGDGVEQGGQGETPAKEPSKTAASKWSVAATKVQMATKFLSVAKSVAEGEPVAGPQGLLQVVAGAPSEKRSTVMGGALSEGVQSWEPFVLTLCTMDQYGNDGTTGGAAVMATLSQGAAGKGSSCQADVADNGDGTYTLNCLVRGDGQWALQVILNQKKMEQSLKVTASPSTLGAAAACMLLPKRPVAGNTTALYVQAVEYGEGRPMTGAENVTMRIVAPSGISTSIPAQYLPKEMRFKGTMEWAEAGVHTVSAAIEGQLVSGCPESKLVMAGLVSLVKSKVQGSGLLKCVAGEQTQFTVNAVDLSGNSLREADEQAAAPLQLVLKVASKSIPGEVVYSGGGVYSCTYTASLAGPLTLSLVCAKTQEERTSQAICLPGRTSPEMCETVMGPKPLAAGELGRFLIRRKDRFRNLIERVTTDGVFEVTCDGLGVMEAKAVEMGDGAVEIQYETSKSGTYQLEVCMDGRAVSDSPYKIEVEAAAAAAALSSAEFSKNVSSQAEGALPCAVAGSLVMLDVAARDQFSNLCKALPPGVTFLVSAERGSSDVPPVELKPSPTGLQYGASLTAAGIYSVSVALHEKQLSAASLEDPNTTHRTAVTTASKLSKSTSRSKVPSVAGSQKTTSTAVGRTSIAKRASIMGKSLDSQEKGAAPSKALDAAALESLEQSAPIPLSGWPRRIQVVAGRVDTNECTIQVEENGRVTCWQPHTFLLHIADKYKNPCTGGHDVVAHLVGPGGKVKQVCEVADRLDGTYSLSFSLGAAGQWTLNATVDGEALPAKCAVEAQVPVCNAADCTAVIKGPTTTGDAAVCGGTSTLYIQSIDFERAGRQMTGKETVKVLMKPSVGPEEKAAQSTAAAAATPAGKRASLVKIPSGKLSAEDASSLITIPVTADKGRFYATLTWMSAGPHVLWVTVNDEGIVGSPLTVQVGGGKCVPKCCTMSGSALRASKTLSWVESAVLVTTADKYGTPCVTGGRQVSATLQADPALPKDKTAVTRVEAEDNQDGTYRIPLLIKSEGLWTMKVTVDGYEINEKPAKLNVVRGRVRAKQCTIAFSETVSENAETRSKVPTIVSGQPLALWVQAKRYNLGHFMAGIEAVALRLVSPSGATLRPTLNVVGGSRFAAQVHICEAGIHEVQAMVDGEPLDPFELSVVPGSINPEMCSVNGLRDSPQRMGQPFQVEVVGRDDFGNACENLELSSVAVTVEPNPELMTHEMEMSEDGRVLAMFTAQSVGDFRVSFSVHGALVASSRVRVRAGPMSLEHVILTMTPFEVTAGEASVVVLQARDAQCNLIREGGEKLVAEVHGGAVEVLDCGDGTYHCIFKITKAGPFELALMQGGVHTRAIAGECFAGPPVASECTIARLEAEVRAGRSHTFRIERRDKHGNLLTRGGSQAAAATSFAAKGESKGRSPSILQIAVTDWAASEDHGCHVDINFAPIVQGTYSISVWELGSGTKVPGSPFTVVVQPGLPCAPCCSAVLRDKSKKAPAEVKQASSWGRLLSKKPAAPSEKKSDNLNLPAGSTLCLDVLLRDKAGVLTDVAQAGAGRLRSSSEAEDRMQVVCRHVATGEDVAMEQVSIGEHRAEFEGKLSRMGDYHVHMVAGGDRAQLPTGEHSGVTVCAGVASEASFHALNTAGWVAFKTVAVSVACRDAFGNEGATGEALVSVDPFLKMSGWLSNANAKKRFELSDPMVTGTNTRTAQVVLPAAGKWRVIVEAPILGEFTNDGLPKYTQLCEQLVDIADNPEAM